VRLLDERLQEVGGELARRERRLAKVERGLAAHDSGIASSTRSCARW